MPQEFDDSILLIQDLIIGGNTYGGGKFPWGFYRTSFSFTPSSPTAPAIPTYAVDPPLPPVFPYIGTGAFSSDLLYGKEKMNTNLEFVRENTFSFDGIALINGEAFDLSSYTMYLTAKKNVKDTSNYFQLTSAPGAGIIITDAPNGAYTVTIPASVTATLPYNLVRLPYDITITNTPIRYTISRGYFKVLPNVTP